MSDFINTIDVLGDDAVIDSIIDKTITEFKDDTLTAIGDYAFYKCTGLKTVELPAVMYIVKNMFTDCSAMEECLIPLAKGINVQSFKNCNSLVSADFPLVTTFTGNEVFDGCSALKSVNFPLLENASGTYSFRKCSSLESVVFPKLEKSGIGDFSYCTSLKRADFTKITGFSGNCFVGCSALTALILRNTEAVCTLANTTNTIATTPIANGAGYVYVPRALVNSYKEATNWSTYAAQIRALEDYTVDGTITGELDETKI